MKTIIIVIGLWGVVVSSEVSAEITLLAKKTKKKSYILPFPNGSQSMMSISSGVMAVSKIGNYLLSFMAEDRFLVATPFEGVKKTQEQTFGTLTASKRVQFPKQIRRGTWVGGVPLKSKLMVFDGRYLKMLNFGLEHVDFISEKSIPWDKIRPAPDRAGPGTVPETIALRKQFRKTFLKTEGLKFSGVAAVPQKWLGGSNGLIFSTRLRNFPIVTARCHEANMSCMLEYACNVEGHNIHQDNLAGVAVSSKRRQILLGDSKNKKIVKYRFDSCFNIVRVGELKLPPKIKGLNSVHVDAEDRLWIVSKKPDDYHNATVYTWASEAW